jgi:molybdopterin-containing oxidoreductase family membrane subunit
MIQEIFRFTSGCLRSLVRGHPYYWLWLGFLLLLIGAGGFAYVRQLEHGLMTTSMRDQVSWAYYIGNFTFLVGVADAAVLLVIPAYIYQWRPIKEVVIFGVLLAIAAIAMAGLFVLVDIGRPERMLHLVPGIGRLNFPDSLLAWDVLLLNSYLVLNVVIASYLLWSRYHGREPRNAIFVGLVLFSIPYAVAVHTVTAFLFNGLVARPFWNSAILAPRFIASSFCSGPAILLILMQLLRRFTRFRIEDAAIWKIAELMAYAMCVNLFLLGAELFTEFYADAEDVVHLRYMFFGVEGHTAIVPYMWLSVATSVGAVVLFLIPKTRRHPSTLNLGCLLIYVGVAIEKGIGLVIPGFTPDVLGEIYEYFPSWNELWVSAGVFGIGFLLFTLLIKVTIPIMLGEHHAAGSPAARTRPGPSAAAAPAPAP